MKSKYADLKEKINLEKIKEAANSIKTGELVLFPTETVYGIGANALDENAVNKIFKAKGRAGDNPLIVHIADRNKIKDIADDITEMEQMLIDAFMPGPFTLILNKKKHISNIVSANLDTVGIRMPDSKIARTIIEKSNTPIAAPSANLSTKPSCTNLNDLLEDFNNKVPYIIDGGASKIGVESTVVKVINGIPTILRPGKITPEDIYEVTNSVNIDKNINEVKTGKVESPGMKYKHYAPSSKCLLVYMDNENDMINEINKHITKNTYVIGYKEHQNLINTNNFYSFGSINNYEEISSNIFSLLRKVDRNKPEIGRASCREEC